MTNRINPIAALAVIVFALVPILGVQQHVFAQNTGPSAVLKIGGNVATPFEISAADLKKMTRKTLSLVNPHNKKTEVYEGVLLLDLFRKAGVPQGDRLRGPVMADAAGANENCPVRE